MIVFQGLQMLFEHGTYVEILRTVSCRVISSLQQAKFVSVKEGERGFVSVDYDTLPGDVAVIMENGDVLAILHGCIAQVDIEYDSESGLPAFKIFRNTREPITNNEPVGDDGAD